MIKLVVEEAISEYPKLMRGYEGTIVLFVTLGLGTALWANDDMEAGYYSATWDMDDFTDFNGSITLSNGSK